VISLALPQPVPALTPVVIDVTGVRNGSSIGTNTLRVTTSSDPVPAAGTLQLTAFTGAVVTGTVTYQGLPVRDSPILICSSDGAGSCLSDVADSNGLFYDPVDFGAYTVTAGPAGGSSPSSAQAVSVEVTTTKAAPVATADVTLTQPTGLPAGSTFSSDGSTSTSGGVPLVFWGAPSTFTTSGPPNGIGFVVITSTNTQTGALVRTVVLLSETSPGSGTYTATIPPLYPSHGAASAEYIIFPAPDFTGPTDLSGGPAKGGTSVLVRVPGKVTAIKFGSVPGSNLQQVDTGLYAVDAPPGTGTVDMTAVPVSAPPEDVGPWQYFPPPTVSKTSGPGDGTGTTTITAPGVGTSPMVFFGPSISKSVTPDGPDTYTVSFRPAAALSPSWSSCLARE